MKLRNILVAITIVAAFVPAHAQITTRQLSDAAAGDIPPYDSSTNQVTTFKCRRFIGQQICILPKSKLWPQNNRPDEMDGYEGFTLTPIDSKKKEDLYKPVTYTSMYTFVSDYNALAGKWFKILDVLDKTSPQTSPSESGLYLKLQGETGDVFYFMVTKGADDPMMISYCPYLVSGYLDKLKRLNKDKKFMAMNTVTQFTDMDKGTPVACPRGSTWTCTDVSNIEIKGYPYSVPVLVLKDSLSNAVAVAVDMKHQGLAATMRDDFKNLDKVTAEKQKEDEEKAKQLEEIKKNTAQQKLQAQKDATASAEAKKARREKLIQKYSQEKGTLIADGHVQIGMTKQMCMDAWGKPSDINTTTTAGSVSAQWVYSMKSYLYFENGILTSIQN